MNALVALCHFCELHGPRTLFCTEALHPPSPTQGGAPVPGERERDGDRDGEGLTMRANSSATQRGDMCEVSVCVSPVCVCVCVGACVCVCVCVGGGRVWLMVVTGESRGLREIGVSYRS